MTQPKTAKPPKRPDLAFGSTRPGAYRPGSYDAERYKELRRKKAERLKMEKIRAEAPETIAAPRQFTDYQGRDVYRPAPENLRDGANDHKQYRSRGVFC